MVQVDTWVSSSGKNGMCRDWLIRDCNTGEILTRASRFAILFPIFLFLCFHLLYLVHVVYELLELHTSGDDDWRRYLVME